MKYSRIYLHPNRAIFCVNRHSHIYKLVCRIMIYSNIMIVHKNLRVRFETHLKSLVLTLATFAKLRKATVSFVMSVRIEQLVSP